jgi:hypothetical protein
MAACSGCFRWAAGSGQDLVGPVGAVGFAGKEQGPLGDGGIGDGRDDEDVDAIVAPRASESLIVSGSLVVNPPRRTVRSWMRIRRGAGFHASLL